MPFEALDHLGHFFRQVLRFAGISLEVEQQKLAMSFEFVEVSVMALPSEVGCRVEATDQFVTPVIRQPPFPTLDWQLPIASLQFLGRESAFIHAGSDALSILVCYIAPTLIYIGAS